MKFQQPLKKITDVNPDKVMQPSQVLETLIAAKPKEGSKFTEIELKFLNKLQALSDEKLAFYQVQYEQAQAGLAKGRAFAFNGQEYQPDTNDWIELQAECDWYSLYVFDEESGRKKFHQFFGALTPAALQSKLRHFTLPKDRVEIHKPLYRDIWSKKEEAIPDYSANYIGNLIIAQGPQSPLNADYKEQFYHFIDVLANQQLNIAAIFAIGPAHEHTRVKHFAYYKSTPKIIPVRAQSLPILSHIKAGEKISQKIICYEIKIKDLQESPAREKTLPVYHFYDWLDGQSNHLTDKDLILFLNTVVRAEKNRQSVLIHCSAGVGRSGVLALAYHLYQKYHEIFKGDDILVIAERIAIALSQLREKRAFLVQTVQQFMMALQLAARMQQLRPVPALIRTTSLPDLKITTSWSSIRQAQEITLHRVPSPVPEPNLSLRKSIS